MGTNGDLCNGHKTASYCRAEVCGWVHHLRQCSTHDTRHKVCLWQSALVEKAITILLIRGCQLSPYFPLKEEKMFLKLRVLLPQQSCHSVPLPAHCMHGETMYTVLLLRCKVTSMCSAHLISVSPLSLFIQCISMHLFQS